MSVVQQVRSKWIPVIETVRSLFGAIAFEVNLCRSHQKGKLTALHQGPCASLCNQENNTHCVTDRRCLFININTSEVDCSGLDPCFCLVHVFHHPSCCFSFILVASVICIWNKIASSNTPLNHLTMSFILRRDTVVLHGWREVLNYTQSLKGLVDMTGWIQPRIAPWQAIHSSSLLINVPHAIQAKSNSHLFNITINSHDQWHFSSIHTLYKYW